MMDVHDCAELQVLWLGPSLSFSVFADEEEAREAWRKHRAVAMVMFAKEGRRPWGWWAFECPPGLRYDDDHEQSILYAADGVLGADERLELERHWRAEFAAAVALRDGKARRKALRDADIPRELIRAWTQERSRNAKAIRKLAATTKEEEAPSPSAS
jgi:hypothetical protein